MIDELTKTINAQLHERVSSPLLSSFALAWCGWNYKIFIIIFSTIGPHAKLKLINDVLFPDWERCLINGFGIPLTIAAALIFLYPWPAKLIYIHTRRTQNALKKEQQTYDDKKPLTETEAMTIKSAALKEKFEMQENMDKIIEENRKLKQELDESKTTLEKIKKMFNDAGENNQKLNQELLDTKNINLENEAIIREIQSFQISERSKIGSVIYTKVWEFLVTRGLATNNMILMQREDKLALTYNNKEGKSIEKRYPFSTKGYDIDSEIEKLKLIISEELKNNMID